MADGTGDRVVAVFDGPADAERALKALEAIGVARNAVTVALQRHPGQPSGVGVDAGSNVAGGAWVGAVFGGALGALIGWMLTIGGIALPGAGPSSGVSALAGTLAGAALGAAIGAVLGGLAGMSVPAEAPVEEAVDTPTEKVVVTVQTAPHLEPAQYGALLGANGGHSLYYTGEQKPVGAIVPLASSASTQLSDYRDGASPDAIDLRSIDDERRATPEVSEIMEELSVNEDTTGVNPNNVTGTEGAIDPDTGTYGTAGTPMTTGYGVSGSTVGTGSASLEQTERTGNFEGATPDTGSYDMGGRASEEAQEHLEGGEPRLPVVDKYADQNADAAPVQQELDPDSVDVYQQGPSYGSDASVVPDADRTEMYSPTDVDAPPTYGATPTASTQAGVGTDIPGTSDMRGLGDNTDEPL